MKLGLGTISLLIVIWLGMWVFNTGVLVYSADTGIAKIRDCRYVIGVSVLKRIEPLADRCPLVRRVGP